MTPQRDTTSDRRPTWKLAAVCMAALVGACGAGPVTRYYTLSSVSPREAAAMAYGGPPIELRGMRVPPSIDREELVREGGAPGEVQVLDFDRWAAPLGRLTRQTLTEDLAQRLPLGKVAVPGAVWPEGRAVLAIDILSFHNDGSHAAMALSWSLQHPPASGTAADTGPAGSPKTRGAMLRVTTASSDANAAETARAWSELLGQVADAIASELNR